MLVPYDTSVASEKALANAIEIARMIEASNSLYKQHRVTITIILLHVLPEIPTPINFGGTPLRTLSKKTGERITFREYLKEAYQEMKETALNMLEQKKEIPINLTNVSIETRVTIGLPADEIVELAIKENAGIIIMGTTGLTGVSKIKAFGSVARNVAERAKCPVMLVR
jgi:nucleotide-binding universal stress UspA family protein